MRHEMGDKKPGPPLTDEGVALQLLIYGYLLHWGADQTDAKIAKRIFESEPRYLHYESGAILFANNEFTEAFMSLPDDPIVGRRPMNLKFVAIKKQVERLRRRAIEEEELPKTHAPRSYRSD